MTGLITFLLVLSFQLNCYSDEAIGFSSDATGPKMKQQINDQNKMQNSSSSSANSNQPINFFKEALSKENIKFTDAKIVTSLDPFVYASRILQYLDRVAIKAGQNERIAWAFYRLQFHDSNGKIQDCTAGVGYKKGYSDKTREVTISDCNQNPFSPSAKELLLRTVSFESAAPSVKIDNAHSGTK